MPLGAETQVLIAACYAGPSPPATSEPTDIPRLLCLADYHRVAGLVYENRARLPLPPQAVESLRRSAQATLHRNLQFAAELKLALRALNGAGVETILLKGAHLVDAVYRNPALRPISDLDLLVRSEHTSQALKALRSVGYCAGPRGAAFGLRHDGEARLEKHGVHGVVIELHTTLNRATRHHWFPMDAIWRRSLPYVCEGQPARVLSPPDNLCFLCAHAVPHAFSQLSWICDIAGVWEMCQPDDRANLFPVAGAAHARRAVFAGLHLVHALLGVEVEDRTLNALAGPAAGRLSALLTATRLFDGARYSTLQSLMFRAALSDTGPDAASVLSSAARRKLALCARGFSARRQHQSLDA